MQVQQTKLVQAPGLHMVTSQIAATHPSSGSQRNPRTAHWGSLEWFRSRQIPENTVAHSSSSRAPKPCLSPNLSVQSRFYTCGFPNAVPQPGDHHLTRTIHVPLLQLCHEAVAAWICWRAMRDLGEDLNSEIKMCHQPTHDCKAEQTERFSLWRLPRNWSSGFPRRLLQRLVTTIGTLSDYTF